MPAGGPGDAGAVVAVTARGRFWEDLGFAPRNPPGGPRSGRCVEEVLGFWRRSCLDTPAAKPDTVCATRDGDAMRLLRNLRVLL